MKKKSMRNGKHAGDYTGQKFHYLTALYSLGRVPSKTGGRGSIYWMFRCDCGVERAMPVDNVRNKSTKSCGCMKRKLIASSRALPESLGIYNYAYSTHLQSAARRGIENYLTRDEYVSVIKKPCHYCGGFSTRYRQKSKADQVQANSADRRNNEPYYKLENVVPACFTCQAMKGAFSEITFLAQAAKITKMRE